MQATNPEDLLTLADISRLYGISYSALNYRAMKLGVEPARVIAERRLFTHAQAQRLIASIAAGRQPFGSGSGVNVAQM